MSKSAQGKVKWLSAICAYLFIIVIYSMSSCWFIIITLGCFMNKKTSLRQFSIVSFAYSLHLVSWSGIFFHNICCLPFSAPVECSKYTVLNTADRASGSFLRGSAKCDRSLSSLNSWHRFEGQAGTRMPTSAVAVNRCGTHAPGWLSQPHPRKEDGVVVRKVCFNWSGNRCRWNVNIRVRNCGAFYVYYLVTTPGCSYRYCGNKNHSKIWISWKRAINGKRGEGRVPISFDCEGKPHLFGLVEIYFLFGWGLS